MNNCLIVPTGIGASIGGFAGDANPILKRLAAVSDLVLTHPNVVNAAMLTDIPTNALVLEGALLDLFFANKIGLKFEREHKQIKRYQHRIAVVVDSAAPLEQREITVNAMNAAKHVYDLNIIEEVFYTSEAVKADLNYIRNEQTLLKACQEAILKGATAIAVLCVLPDDDSEASRSYSFGKGYDPIGKIEAEISHLISSEFLIPSAHAPIFDQTFKHSGVVAPRVAAEFLGLSFLPSVFKCLEAMPEISANHRWRVAEIDNLLVPFSSCDAPPMKLAEEHDVNLICIEENTTLEKNKSAVDLGLKHQLLHSYDDFFVTL